MAQAIKAALLKDDSIDGVVTISAGDADSAASAIEQAGVADKVKLGTFDMDDDAACSASRTASSCSASTSSPTCRATWPCRWLNSYVHTASTCRSSPLLTGPAIIDAANVDAAIAGAKAGVR